VEQRIENNDSEQNAAIQFVDRYWLILFTAWMIGMAFFLAPARDLKIFGDDFNSWTKVDEVRDFPAGELFFKSYDSSFFRPFEMLLVRSNLRAHGFTPKLYHTVTIIGHILASLLVLILARRLALGKLAALCAAMLFSAHQAGAMAVLSSDSAGQVYCTVFGLVSLIALIDKDKTPTWKSVTIASVFLMAALLAKDGAVSFFAAALLVIGVNKMKGRIDWRRAILLSLPFVAVMLIYFALRAQAHMAPPSFGDESRYQFHVGLNLFKDPALMLLSMLTPIGTHKLAASREDFVFLAFVAHLLLILAATIFGGLFAAYKKDAPHRNAVLMLFGFLFVALYPECFMVRVSELYTYKPNPFFCVLVGLAFAQVFTHALNKRNSFATGFIALLFVASLGLNLSAFQDKQRLMRSNGENAKNALREIKMQVPTITKNTTTVLANLKDELHYSVFYSPGAYLLAVPEAFKRIYKNPVAGFEIVAADAVEKTCEAAKGDCLALVFDKGAVAAELKLRSEDD
jgi:hypothetical protein